MIEKKCMNILKKISCKHKYEYFERTNIGDEYKPVYTYIFICKKCGKEVSILGETIQKIANKLSYEYSKKLNQFNCKMETSYINSEYFHCIGWYISEVTIHNPYILFEMYEYFYNKYNVNILEISGLDIDKIIINKDNYNIYNHIGVDDGKYRCFYRERLDFSSVNPKFEYYFINYDGKVISISDIDVIKYKKKLDKKIRKNMFINKQSDCECYYRQYNKQLKEWFDKKYFKDSNLLYESCGNGLNEYVYYD